jgi:hypothetical protein
VSLKRFDRGNSILFEIGGWDWRNFVQSTKRWTV